MVPRIALADNASNTGDDALRVYEGDLLIDSKERASVVGNAGRVSLDWLYSSKSFHWTVTLFATAPRMSIAGTLRLRAFDDNGSSSIKSSKNISGAYGQASWSGTWSPRTVAQVNYNGELYVQGFDATGVQIAHSLGTVTQPVYYSS